jgi:hypothetical protein
MIRLLTTTAGFHMTHNWQSETLRDEDAVFDLLTQLRGGQ